MEERGGPGGEASGTQSVFLAEAGGQKSFLAEAGGMDLPRHRRVRDYFADHSRDSFSGGWAGSALDGIPMGALVVDLDEAKAGAVVAAEHPYSTCEAQRIEPGEFPR